MSASFSYISSCKYRRILPESFGILGNKAYLCTQKSRIICVMTYLNQFHKEATERKLRKIAELQKSPMNSVEAANYMKRNFQMAKAM